MGAKEAMDASSEVDYDVDYDTKCKCDKQEPIMVNYQMMWHEADIICGNCDGFIRYWDAG
jgi:hypothetical protein